ncbi:MAG: recombinase family protein [Roseiarcus sp.]
MRQVSSTPVLRCAIYTRVSTDQGLEQDFNSLDAQREAAEAYIKSQAHEGWRPNRDHYDDGGYSGGSMERPALQKLLADIRSRRIDVVVVYKVDRLTRSLADFAKLVELFDAHKVSFVSVTQSFNTTTSMGRLTLNVLLSFAQFEREVTGERIRDKIAASKRKGIWVGGVSPLGYRVVDRKLLIDEPEAETVRIIFQRYLALGSLPATAQELRERGILTRRRDLATGRTIGGVSLSKGPLAYMLKNRVYLGEINHRDKSYPGEHQPIVDQDLFDAVQARLNENLGRRRHKRAASLALLLGHIYDDHGNRMTPTYAIRQGVRYRYYVSCVLAQGRKEDAGSLPRIPAPEIEAAVLGALRSAVARDATPETNGGQQDDRVDCEGDRSIIARNLSEASPTITPHDRSERQLVERHLERVVVKRSAIEIAWRDPDAGSSSDVIRIPWTPMPRYPRREIIPPRTGQNADPRPQSAETRNRLLAEVALGRRWVGQMMKGDVKDVGALARREAKSERAIRTTLSLAFLAPAIVRGAIEGRLPRGVGISNFEDLPLAWSEQRSLIEALA